MGAQENDTKKSGGEKGHGEDTLKPPKHFLYMPGQGTQVMISRAPFTQTAFDDIHQKREGDEEKVSLARRLKEGCFCSKRRAWRLVTGYIPLIKVIRYYKLKEYAITDIFAGLSVGTIHLPQALAFGLLASAKVRNGLLASLWPPLVYFFFGTSPHVSMGTSAVLCLLTASTIDREGQTWARSQPDIMMKVANGTSLDDISQYMDFKEQIGMSLSLIIGAILIGMGLLRLGFITSYLSDSFFAAFTSAAAVHIGTTQLPPMLGIVVPRFPGIFKLINTYEAIFDRIMKANFAAIIIALICIILIWIVKDGVNEKFKDKLFAPIPVELFIVIFGTIASYFGNFQEKYKINVVGQIDLGIPVPFVPTQGLALASNFIVDAVIMAILNFAYTIAIAKICAKKHNYELDDSQEMFSYGLCNFASSFLQCIPSCISPPRAMVASSMNAKTTVNGIFSCLLIFLVVMVVVPLFKQLPKAVLAAIIFISLKSLFIQIGDCVKYWRVNKFDFFIWFCTFFSTVFLDIDIGLYIGVGVSALTVVIQTQCARSYKLGYTKKDPALVEYKKYKDSSEICGIKVFRFQSNLYYATAEIFRNALYRKTVNPRKLLKGLQKREKRLQKLNEERIAQGLPPQHDNNFIMTGKTDKLDNNISCSDLNALSPHTSDLSNPLSILKRPAENGTRDVQSSPDLCSLDQDGDNKRELADFDHKPGMNGVKKVQLPALERPVFTIDGITNLSAISEPNLNKRSDKESLEKLKNSESVVSLYSISFDDYEEDPDDGDELFTDEKLRQMRKIHHVIIDCSTINYIDASGTNVLMHLYSEYGHVNIKVFLAGCSAYIRHTMRQAGVFSKIPESNFFLDVHDAISYARPQRPQPIGPENIRDFTYEEAIENSRAVNL